ncbi:hypothetical protein M2132_000609 [Dysgonomonas sp. PH5-45]|nr:hypothetical protein [Dysgonomonas sp. PH5-45]MDH6387182.1 hypothetical protein [Dysgonomonas sp. PH5-37]
MHDFYLKYASVFIFILAYLPKNVIFALVLMR